MGACVLPLSYASYFRPAPCSETEHLRSGRSRCFASCTGFNFPSLNCSFVQTSHLVGSSLRGLCVASAQQRAPPQESRNFHQQATKQKSQNKPWQKNRLSQPVKERIPAPWEVTAYIKGERQEAMHAMKKHNALTVITQFTQRMEQLCQKSSENLNNIHMSAILSGTAKVWSAAVSNNHGWTQRADAETVLHAFLHGTLTRLQEIMPEITTRSASNMLWSLAKMDVNPDHLVPGTVDSLAQQFMKEADSADGHSYASFLLACADLGLKPCNGGALPQLLVHLSHQDLTLLDKQAVVNTVHALARVRAPRPSSQLLDNLCASFLTYLRSTEESDRPSSQEIANLAWALKTLRHVPPHELSSACLARMLSLCQTEGKRPNPQEISIFLLGCAELRLPVTMGDFDRLVSYFLSQTIVKQQHVTNVAWSLAVAGRLQLPTYEQMLQRMLSLAAAGTAPINVELVQMHQALHGVQLPMTDRLEQKALKASMQDTLNSMGPAKLDTRFLSNYGLFVALTDLGLAFKTGRVVKTYYVHAVVQPQVNTVKPMFIMLEYGYMDQCFSNDVTRLAGREAYCRRVLAQSGAVIAIPPDIVLGGEEMMAGYLRTALKAASGGDLNAYRRKKQ